MGYVAARQEHAAGPKDTEWDVAARQAVVAGRCESFETALSSERLGAESDPLWEI